MPLITSILSQTEEDGVSRWGTKYFTKHMRLILKVRGQEKPLTVLIGENAEQLVIGRGDPQSGEKPAVDLNTYDDDEAVLGVSRRHAKIVWSDNKSLNLLDLDSANGTYLNGSRLIPNQPRILRNGDQIRLGKLVVSVEFYKVAKPPQAVTSVPIVAAPSAVSTQSVAVVPTVVPPSASDMPVPPPLIPLTPEPVIDPPVTPPNEPAITPPYEPPVPLPVEPPLPVPYEPPLAPPYEPPVPVPMQPPLPSPTPMPDSPPTTMPPSPMG